MMSPCSANNKSNGPSAQMLTAYGFFLLSASAVWHLVADGAFSSVLTMSVMVQCLAVVLMALQVISTGSAAGISGNALALDALALCFRLSSTLWLNGYLPVDASGDYVFQAFDICSLCILAWLLYQVFIVHKNTYQANEDSLQITPLILGSLVLAVLLHGNMNGRPFFDALWMSGLFISTVAVLPQLWLIAKTGGCVEALTSHYIAATAASRALSGLFMWHAVDDITCDPWIGDFNHASWAILGAHFLQLVLLADFAYYYVRAVFDHGLNCRIEISLDCNV